MKRGDANLRGFCTFWSSHTKSVCTSSLFPIFWLNTAKGTLDFTRSQVYIFALVEHFDVDLDHTDLLVENSEIISKSLIDAEIS